MLTRHRVQPWRLIITVLEAPEDPPIGGVSTDDHRVGEREIVARPYSGLRLTTAAIPESP